MPRALAIGQVWSHIAQDQGGRSRFRVVSLEGPMALVEFERTARRQLVSRFAVGWFQRSDGLYAYSLRSRGPDGVDVSEIAKKYGGGGHRNSAGFTLAERLPV